jgi:hypothetical protein
MQNRTPEHHPSFVQDQSSLKLRRNLAAYSEDAAPYGAGEAKSAYDDRVAGAQSKSRTEMTFASLVQFLSQYVKERPPAYQRMENS